MGNLRDKRSILSAAQINAVGVVFTLLATVSLMPATASAMPCPIECQCSFELGDKVFVDCSGLSLSVLPEMDPAMEINWLDLSNNILTEFPEALSTFSMLESLDLTGNQIKSVPATALNSFQNLKTLTLNRNNITNWQDIHPNELLTGNMISALHLSGNPLTSFSSTDESLVLVSPTLRYLDISKCRITKVNGGAVLQGLERLEYLDLSGNPLRYVANLVSGTLHGLDLSNCQLSSLPGDFLAGLPALIRLSLARNHRLSLARAPDEFVKSDSLTKIDLSFCNMDNVELFGFPQLKSANLRGNLIKDLTRDSFANNPLLESLELPSNAISQMHSMTFSHLKQLQELDLSFNMLSRIERETFKENGKLATINLSRNYIGRFNRIVSSSLNHLNLSSCEIVTIDGDALVGLPSLIELDLSQNLIAAVPDSLVSETLQVLDLRMCRISSIRNGTLENLPELSRLRLSGNRFTTPFRKEFFDQNPYLTEIWLGDNPWRCDCSNQDFYKFFRFVTEKPPKLYDRSHVRCASPEDLYGSQWEMACFSYWIQNNRPLGTAEKVWTIVLVALLVFAGSMCLVMTMKRCVEGRKLTRRERERQAFLEEQQDVRRQNRMAMEQQAQLNAPDPRETRPPCYEDALLLPRLDGSFASLNELGEKKEYKKGVRIPKDTTDVPDTSRPERPVVDLRVAPRISPRNRSSSEEVLSMRDLVANRRSGKYRSPTTDEPNFENHHYANISRSARRSQSKSRLPTSPPPTRIPTPPPDLPPPPPVPGKSTAIFQSNSDLHYHSTEILNMVPGTKTPTPVPLSPVLSMGSATNSADYDELEDFATTRESPYSRRKSRNLSTFKIYSSKDEFPEPDEILVVEDHYPRMPTPKPQKRDEENISYNSSSSTSQDEGFEAVSASDLAQTNEIPGKGSKDVVVQVHREPPQESSL